MTHTQTTAQRVRAALQGALDINRAIEELLVDVLAALTPWLAPVIPAYLAWRNMTGVLGFNGTVALVGAVVVEFLGLATVHTVFMLWSYNQDRRKSDPRAPLWVAGAMAGVYVAIVLMVNALLDGGATLHRVAQALLSLLSVVGAVTLAVRAQHARRLADIRAEKAERRQAGESGRKVAGNLPQVADERPATSGNLPADWRQLPAEDRRLIKELSTREIMAKYAVPERTARNWATKARSNGHIPAA